MSSVPLVSSRPFPLDFEAAAAILEELVGSEVAITNRRRGGRWPESRQHGLLRTPTSERSALEGVELCVIGFYDRDAQLRFPVKAVRGASWDGSALRIWLGNDEAPALVVEPLDGTLRAV